MGTLFETRIYRLTQRTHVLIIGLIRVRWNKMVEKRCLKGLVDKVKVLELEVMPLVRFTLVVDDEHSENCLIKQHSLNFLFQASEGKTVIIYGKRNNRNQFVVTKYHVK